MRPIQWVVFGVCALGLTGCAGSGVAPVAEEPAAPADQFSGQTVTEPTAGETSDNAAGEERVRAADLPGEPDGAVGFAFGDGPDDAEAACTRGGHAWKKVDNHIFHCDGLPDAPGMQGTVFVQTCGGQVCLLRVALNPSEDSEAGWLALYDSALKSLVQRHGEPWKQQSKLPQRCQGDELKDCLEKGDAALDATWQWPGGEKVELRMVPPARARSIAVRLTYSAAP